MGSIRESLTGELADSYDAALAEARSGRARWAEPDDIEALKAES